PDYRGLPPPLHGLQRPASRTRLPPPPRQALRPSSNRLDRNLRRPRSLSFRKKRPRTCPRRSAPSRFPPRLPRWPLAALRLIAAEPVDRASPHHPPALVHASLEPLSICSRRPRPLFLCGHRCLPLRLLQR